MVMEGEKERMVNSNMKSRMKTLINTTLGCTIHIVAVNPKSDHTIRVPSSSLMMQLN